MRRSVSLQGCSAARTQVHLAVAVGAEILSLQGSAEFIMLPLVQVGDTVDFTYTLVDDEIYLETFGIIFPGEDETEEDSDQESAVFQDCGIVLRKAESLQGGDAARTQVHLVVDVTGENTGQPLQVCVFIGSGEFTMLPLVEVGDTVRYSYRSGRDGAVDLIDFEICYPQS